MRSVLKWDVPVDDQWHAIGSGKVALVGNQGNPALVQVWTDEPDTENVEYRMVRVYGTGHKVPKKGPEHIGSVIVSMFVWHVFSTPATGGVDGNPETAI